MTSTAPTRVSRSVFLSIQRQQVSQLFQCSESELRPVLAALVRMSLIASRDSSEQCQKAKTTVLQVLSNIELVNNLVALLSIDFHALETDVKKEQSIRAKLASGAPSESVLIGNLNLGPALEFERSEATRRLRLVLSELLAIMGQIAHQKQNEEAGTSNDSPLAITLRASELFDHVVYLPEICDVLAIAMAELPNLLKPSEVCEALLRLKYGPNLICHVVANQPDSFTEVALHLLKNGDKQDDESPISTVGDGVPQSSNRLRQNAILMLCEMNPAEVVAIRTKCIEWCKMPSLALMLTLEEQKRHKNDSPDLVSFMSGLLLGSDPQVRNWISFFIRNGQKKRNPALSAFRDALLNRLRSMVKRMRGDIGSDAKSPGSTIDVMVKASALLRLYTALRGIAGMKFSEEEIQLLLDLITSKSVPPTPAGVKFVSLGLCILLACNSLISSPTYEKRAIDWLRWLLQEEDYFERKSGVSASFGEMLLLMAIHFHSNQLSAIGDLVCQTLGMKIQIRTNGMNRMKNIFTQDLFTEQVVAAHAVKVPVTPSLSSTISGFLPVHCIHQLLKSRTFSKHRVPIKDWIFQQICASTEPIHPVMPALIEGFVNSVLVPASSGRGVPEQTNEPISEADLRSVFRSATIIEKRKAHTSREGTPFKLRGSPTSMMRSETDEIVPTTLASQILLLYYVLQYEQVRLSHMRTILSSQRKVLHYSKDLIADLPIKFLLRATEKDAKHYGVIFPQLLRLCYSQYPHLCLLEDWLDDTAEGGLWVPSAVKSDSVNSADLEAALAVLECCPAKFTLLAKRLLQMRQPHKLWQYSGTLLRHARLFLEVNVARQSRDHFNRLWFEFNKMFPRKLWAMTVNGLAHQDAHLRPETSKQVSHEDLILDPLTVLRCDKRVFRAGPILEIVIYMLKACLAASRTHLTQHIQENPIFDRAQASQVTSDQERESLRDALISTQESAAAQILLEAINVSADEKDLDESSALTDLKEAQSLVCSYLHEAFIADPNLAKLVHFQGYPPELLAVTVPGVPSMHICLDYAVELLSQPDLEKQAFAVDLVSQLSVQYSMPRSYSIARLAVNSLSTLISVLTPEERNVLFPPVLPAFVRFCKAFPPLREDVIGLLLQYGKVCISESCFADYTSPHMEMLGHTSAAINKLDIEKQTKADVEAMLRVLPANDPNVVLVQKVFLDIVDVCLRDLKIDC